MTPPYSGYVVAITCYTIGFVGWIVSVVHNLRGARRYSKQLDADLVRLAEMEQQLKKVEQCHEEVCEEHARLSAFVWFLINHAGMPESLADQARQLLPKGMTVEVVDVRRDAKVH